MFVESCANWEPCETGHDAVDGLQGAAGSKDNEGTAEGLEIDDAKAALATPPFTAAGFNSYSPALIPPSLTFFGPSSRARGLVHEDPSPARMPSFRFPWPSTPSPTPGCLGESGRRPSWWWWPMKNELPTG